MISRLLVRWSDWGDDFTKGFLEEAEKNAGINVDWDVCCGRLD